MIAVITATRDRCDVLEITLRKNASAGADIFVVVDASSPENFRQNELNIERLRASEKTGSPKIFHLKAEEVGLTKQKNQAVDFLRPIQPNFVQILDDDVSVRLDYFQKCLTFIQDYEAIGISGVTSDLNTSQHNHYKFGDLVEIVFGMAPLRPGAVSLLGQGRPVCKAVDEPQKADWLIGCSFWNWQIFDHLKYDECLPGGGLFEDVEFSVRAKRHGELLVLTGLVLDHLRSPLERPDYELSQYRNARNRLRVTRSLSWPTLRRILWYQMFFIRASIRYLLAPFARQDQEIAQRKLGAIGMFRAIRDEAIGSDYR